MDVILRIFGIAARHRSLMGATYLCTAGATVAYLFLPRLIGDAVERIADIFVDGGVSGSTVISLTLVIVGLYAVRGVLTYGQNYLGESLSQYVSYDIRNAFYDHVQHLGFGFHDRHHTGNLISRAITDVENIRMFINMGMVRTPYFLVLFIAVAVILLRLDLMLGLMSVGFIPLVIVQSAVVRLKMRRIWLSIQEKMADLSTVLQENLTGVRVVKAFAASDHELSKFDAKSTGVADDMIRAERLRASNTAFMLFCFQLSLGVILLFGGWRVINGQMGYGELVQFILYMQILAMPIRMAGWMVNSYARAASAGQRLFEILDTESPVREAPGAREMPRARGAVSFSDLTFSYDGSHPVLRNVSFRAEPGQVVALLGPPGSGKSTIVSLISRFYDVPPGSITIDGVEIRDMTLASLRRNIGLVQQDVFLFSASIRENIAYGRADATMEEIVQAARVAQLHDYIEGLEQGYDTIIGERGSTLSGGQRQRLSIARAVLLDPPILVLDDSTSSVDANTERLIRQAMESVIRGRTTFVIAHRLGTVHKADQILVLRDGEIAERGRHRDLLAYGGLYREIYDLQLRPQEEVMREIEIRAPVKQEAVL